MSMLAETDTARKADSLLERYLSCDSAAQTARQQIRRQQREDALRYRATGSRSDGTPNDIEAHSLRAEICHLREEQAELRRQLRSLESRLPETIDERVRSIVADELPSAIRY